MIAHTGLLTFIFACVWIDAAPVTLRSSRPVVYFKAFISKNVQVSKGTTLKFDNVVANTGNAYNPHSGVFIAPVSGIYLLTVILGTDGSAAGDFKIQNQKATEAYVTIKSGYDTAPMTTIAHVNKGDHVFVTRAYGGSIDIRGSKLAQFSGLLLRAD